MTSIIDQIGFKHIPNILPEGVTTFIKVQLGIENTLSNYFRTNYETDSVYSDSLVGEGSFNLYGSTVTETLLLMMKPILEQELNKQLYPTYSFGRTYYKNNYLKSHYDSILCEYSVTISIAQEAIWPIVMVGLDSKEYIVGMNIGDMVIYKGIEVLHSRPILLNNSHTQVFLHYVDANGKYAELKYDLRPYVGFPPVYPNLKGPIMRKLGADYKFDLNEQI